MAHHPILVTGATRSGTTWVGRMLCASGEAAYINEPFNPIYRPGWAAGTAPEWHTYITEENEGRYARSIDDVVRLRYPIGPNLRYVRSARSAARFARDLARSVRFRWNGARPLVKDPFAVFSAPWFERRYAAKVVVMIRHPAGVVASMLRLGWPRDLRDWTEQPALMHGVLAAYADEIRVHADGGDPHAMIDRAILTWNGVYSAVRRYREEHPDWEFVRYEDLAESPVPGFRRLYAALELRWNQRAAAVVGAHSAGSNPAETDPADPHEIRIDSRSASRSWLSRLTRDDIDRIRLGTADVWPAFYSPEDWEPAERSAAPPERDARSRETNGFTTS